MFDHPVNADQTAIVFLDLQEGIINAASTADRDRLRTCVAALADLAILFSIPVIVSCVPTTSGAVAPLLEQIAMRFPAVTQHVRTVPNAMHDHNFRTALETTGRRTIVIAGVASEVAVALVAMSARRDGYDVIVAVDACSGIDGRSESTTFTHLSALGIALSSVPTIAAELTDDFNSERGRAAMRTLQSMLSVAHSHEHDHDGHEHA